LERLKKVDNRSFIHIFSTDEWRELVEIEPGIYEWKNINESQLPSGSDSVSSDAESQKPSEEK
jgi:hypothetical protein